MRLAIIDDNSQYQTNGVVTTVEALKQEFWARGLTDTIHITPDWFTHVPAGVYPGARFPLDFWRCREFIANFEPTHLHICTEGPLGLYARRIFQNKGWKYTTSFHTRWDLYMHKSFGINPKITMRYLKWFHKHSAAVLINTKTQLEELQQQGFNNLECWSRGVDKELFSFSSGAVDTKPTLLSVGRLSREKNLDDFCQLDHTQYHLRCVGDGPERKRLETQYPWVIFLGELKGKALASEYQKADCFVFPSKSDTFGLVMIESMSCGTPVAAYPVQGPLDAIDQGVTGVMNQNLRQAVEKALMIPRATVHKGSHRWTWSNTADIFLRTLVDK